MAEKAAPSAELQAAREKLAPFSADNPTAAIVEIQHDGELRRAIMNPWNDRSVAFKIPDDDDTFFEELNSVILPERFTALYHKDTRCLEVIWTAYKLPE